MKLYKIWHTIWETNEHSIPYKERFVYAVLANTKEEAIEKAKHITPLYCRDKGEWSGRMIPGECFGIRAGVNEGDD